MWSQTYGKEPLSKRGNPLLPLLGYSFRLAARVLIYSSSHREDNTYHSLCYTSCGASSGTRNSSMGQRINPSLHHEQILYHAATSCSYVVLEGNILFNDALNTFCLWLYGVGCKVKDHLDSEKENLLQPLHGLLFSSKGSFIYMHHLTDMIVYTTAFVTPVVEHWLELEIAQWINHGGWI